MTRRTALTTAIVTPAALAQQAAWKPVFLDAHQNETVIALTDLLIPATDTPGAKDANVNRYIDLFLADGDATQRARFVEGLGMLDGRAAKAHGQPFVKLTRDWQTALLTELDSNDDAFFRLAKSLTSRIYFNTAQGYRQLNKGGRVPKTFACSA
ncbi:MAG: gluconate 2-dehydrogenase subunit 3 family protein [Bryobacteraceae bacterium]|nr:gluconate 2-dehydrogenase subunit 3 family protein [Bryobacteraceae bacterium]